MNRILIAGLTLAATWISAGQAVAAPRWLPAELPFGGAPALQNEAGAAMAPDGRIVFARVAPEGSLEVRERPAGGPVGATVTIAPEAEHLNVLVGADGTAAVLFDEGGERYAALRAPGGAWGSPQPAGPPGAEAIAPSGELWRVGPAPWSDDRLAIYRASGVTLLPAPPQDARDVTPALALPGAGGAHVAYVEEGTSDEAGLCQAKTVIVTVDVSATGEVGRATRLDSFRASGNGSADACALDDGELIEDAPQLLTDARGADTLAFGVRAFPSLAVRSQARHREAGATWPLTAEPVEQIGDGAPKLLVGGRGLPLLAFGDSVAERLPGGTWTAPQPLSNAPLHGARTGAGTTVFTWAERGTGRVIGRVVDANGMPGDPVELAPAAPGTMALGAGGDAEGNGVALYSRPAGDDFVLTASGFDAAPPRVTSVSVPSEGAANEPLEFTAGGLDVWSGPVTDVVWDFGDGTTGRGIATTHAYANAGDRVVQVTLRDSVGNATSAFAVTSIDAAQPRPLPTTEPAPVPVPVPVPVPASPPVRDTRAPSFSLRHGPHATLLVTSDEPGRLTVALTAHRQRRTITKALPAGIHRVALPKLTRGRWTATATITDAAGNRSRPHALRFRVPERTGRPGDFSGPFPPDR